MNNLCLFCKKELSNDRFKHLRKFCSLQCSKNQKRGGFPNPIASKRTKQGWEKRRKHGLNTPWNKGKSGQKGEKNYFWNGGKKVFLRKRVLKRDSYTCKNCKLKNKLAGFMDIDHIKPKSKYPNLKYNMKNLITLCPNCHRIKTLNNKELS